MFIRYEDLITDTISTIKMCVEFLNSLNVKFSYNSAKIKNIYSSTKFEKLEKQERDSNFKIGKDKNFFRKGNLDNSDVSLDIKNKLSVIFENTMKKFNYL